MEQETHKKITFITAIVCIALLLALVYKLWMGC